MTSSKFSQPFHYVKSDCLTPASCGEASTDCLCTRLRHSWLLCQPACTYKQVSTVFHLRHAGTTLPCGCQPRCQLQRGSAACSSSLTNCAYAR